MGEMVGDEGGDEVVAVVVAAVPAKRQRHTRSLTGLLEELRAELLLEEAIGLPLVDEDR